MSGYGLIVILFSLKLEQITIFQRFIQSFPGKFKFNKFCLVFFTSHKKVYCKIQSFFFFSSTYVYIWQLYWSKTPTYNSGFMEDLIQLQAYWSSLKLVTKITPENHTSCMQKQVGSGSKGETQPQGLLELRFAYSFG